jgi:signal transduction histidine kinase
VSAPDRVLVVDDREENLVATAALLTRDGVEVHTARTGIAALELVLAHDFAVAVLDVQMPEMDGFELAQLMRGARRSRDVPIIFVTAAPDDPQRVLTGYESGAVDFLSKPLDARVLRAKVDVFLALHRHRRALAERVAERDRLVAQLEDTVRLNETLAAVVGHDLRTPLQAILNGAEVMRRTPGVPELGVRNAERILSAGRRMARMIQELLDFARARQAGGIPVTVGPADLAAIAGRIVDEQGDASPGRQLRLEVRGDPVGRWDADRLEQLVSNLLANAVSHGSPEAPITIGVDGTAPGRVSLTFHNAGAIPPELLPTLFEPFRRSEPRDATRREGLGLGLYIVKQIALAHGGRIDVRSEPGDGTTFTVELPRDQGASARAVLDEG